MRRTPATRERLPNRRQAKTFALEYGGKVYQVTVGFFHDARPGEVFISGAKVGSDADGLHADIGVLLSRLLQCGDSLGALAAGMGRLGNNTTPCSIIGAALDRLVAEGP